MSKNSLLFKSVICVLAFALLLGCAVYLAVRPISYNMEYFGELSDEYGYFNSHRYYTRNKYAFNKNTNYDLPIVEFYYYKDGYVFSLRSETEEQYAQETEKINSRWEDALKVDFYASRINAYKMIFVRPDGVETIYTCKGAIVLTVVCVAAALIAAGLSCSYIVRYKKTKREECPSCEVTPQS